MSSEEAEGAKQIWSEIQAATSEAQDTTESTGKAADAANIRKRQGRASSPGVKTGAGSSMQGEAKDTSAKADDSLQHKKSIYALVPDKVWLYANHRWSFMFFGAIALAFLALCCLLTPSFKTLRLLYTLVSCALLVYRFKLYYQKQWLAFFIEFCYVVNFFLIGGLWICPSGGCSQEWELGVYIAATGAVAGATFPLQMGLALHHPEAFETFFLHNTPMWMCYAIRWREMVPLPAHTSLLQLVWFGFSRVYLVWIMLYLPFALVQPFLPDVIAGAETLSDGFLFADCTKEERLKKKRGDWKGFAKNLCMALGAHCGLSLSGLIAAAMAFQYHKVQVVWICAVLAGCVDVARKFYKRSADPTIPDPGLVMGMKRMGGAWALLIPTYLGCWFFGLK